VILKRITGKNNRKFKKHNRLVRSQMNLTINSPMLAGRLTQFIENWEKGNARLMGPASHKRISAGTGSIIMPVETNSINKLPDGAEGNDQQRDQRTTGQGCSIRDYPFNGKLCVSDLLDDKGAKASNKPEAFNRIVKPEYVKMEGLHILPHLIQLEDWMIKLDMMDAYLQIPIHVEH